MNPITPNIEPKPTPCRKAVARVSLKAVLTGLLLALASEASTMAQTVAPTDDGTVLKEIIIFGRHSIRAPTTSATPTNSQIGLNQCAAESFPAFPVQPGYLTPNGKQAARLLGGYFHDYLVHEGLLSGNSISNLAHAYFRANIIERSYMTAARFGSGLMQCEAIPVHTYQPDPDPLKCYDPVFDPLLARVATVVPLRALTEVQGVFGNGTNIARAYSGELSLISRVLYPPGTKPLLPPGTQPAINDLPASVDPTTLAITLSTNQPVGTNHPTWYSTGGVIGLGGLDTIVNTADPFVMEYADGFATTNVGWGRLTPEELSQQTRINTLQLDICMRQPYLARVQSSDAASHILRTMSQAVTGTNLAGAFGDTNSQIHVIISSDYYVAGVAGLLNADWFLPGYEPDFCTPGGALVFELRQVRATEDYLVRVFYTAQTLDQLRNLSTLSLTNPPATMQLFIPGADLTATNLDISFAAFSDFLTDAIDLECVEPFDTEQPPGVLDPYIAANATNITATVNGNTLTIAWPDDHLGWILQAQTNGLGSGQWFDVPGSSDTSSLSMPMDPATPAVFYRLSRQ
jgi:4-phytase/acid phosphatase